tara:strand:+ start:11106 stop:11717 length:612 start_codon:yes stop_codon:yes gene_type:complete
MINNDKIQNTRIKRLKVIFPILALIVIFIIFIQSIKIEINDEDKNLTLILSDNSNEGVLKPSMIGETSSGQPFVLNALKASPLGPGLKDIQLENVSITLGREGVQTISVDSRNAKYFARDNIAIFFDDIISKTSDGYDFIAQVVNVNLETGFTFLDGPVQGRKGDIEFDAGHVEIHERGNKIYISSGVKLTIPASFMQQIKKE